MKRARAARPSPEGPRYRCPQCRGWLLAAAFYPRVTSLDGLSSFCRACSARYLRRWRAAHRDDVRAWDRGYKRAYRTGAEWRGHVLGAAKGARHV